jgi:phytoene dehydrogenase-like protein
MPHDAIIIGSGPNGLTAAATLAKAGLSCVLFEAQPDIGGAAATRALTEPGFLHDVGGAFFPFGPVSPGFLAHDLTGAGLRWRYAPVDSAHLAANGEAAILSRDLGRTVRDLGADGEVFAALARWRIRLGETFDRLTLDPLPLLAVGAKLDLASLARFAELTLSSSAGYGQRKFSTPTAQRVIADLCLHADIGPSDPCGAVLGGVLALLAMSGGFPVAEGGAGTITAALARRYAEAGGILHTSQRVTRVLVRQGKVMGVRLSDGSEVEAPLVMADVSTARLAFDLVGPEDLPAHLRSAFRRARRVWGTFKMDWALDGPVPWRAEGAREANVVHVADSLEGLQAFTDTVRSGDLPEDPYLVVGQQSLADPTRAPPGKHVLYAYTHVPTSPAGGSWLALRDAFADRIERWIETQAPGFRALIRARHIAAPPDLEAGNANLVGGDLGGGSSRIDNLLFFRPAFPYFRYRMGIEGLYLCSSFAHPGAGVHGACGYNAARVALRQA